MANTYQPKSFKYGFFDCCGNVGDCLFACILPDCYAFVAAQDAGEDTMCAILQCCCYPLGLCFLRSNAREKRGIDGSFVEDVLASCCCPCCTAIQIRREFRE